MIHLRIISASNLPSADKNGKSDPYIMFYPQNFGILGSPIAKTKTIKKTLNPRWDQHIMIPFVAFDSMIRLVFMDADKLSDDERLGILDIFPSISNFYRHDAQIQVANINIDSQYKISGPSTLEYSIIPSFANFDIKEKKDPKRTYVYLSFDSFQPASQDTIRLLVYGVNKEGTIVDAIYDVHSRGEVEASHFSPMGLVQVYSFDKTDFWETALVSGEYFFILYSNGFIGKVTLTFVSSPKNASEKKFAERFHIFNNQYSLNVSGQGQFFKPFPCTLKFSKMDVKIQPLSIPSNLQTLNISNSDEYMPKLEEMMTGIGQLICPHDKPLHIRFDSEKGKRYSLNELFLKSHSKSSPLKINVAIGWDSYTDLDLLIFPLTNDDRLLDPIGSKGKKHDTNRSIQSQGDSKRGTKYGDNEIITIDLNNVDSSTKCLLIAVSSYQCMSFNRISGGYLRIVDCMSSKEVLFYRFTEGGYKTGLLWGVLGRIGDSWSVWPCDIFMEGSTAKSTKNSLIEVIKGGLIDRFRTAQ